MSVAILGAGAFGTALGLSLARAGHSVALWGRALGPGARESARLPGHEFPEPLRAVPLDEALRAEVVLMAIPAQTLGAFARAHGPRLSGKQVIACCKGIDIATGLGPVGVLEQALNGATVSILTGPSFAADIARSLPTALTLACRDGAQGRALQHQLSTPNLRLYLTTDTAGAELGGALKNVIAIACGAAIGAGLGDSARAAVMTRGFAEMQRLAPHFGATPETLSGLSGLGDLALTCTSTLSRNYRLGLHLGQGAPADPGETVEGAATAKAVTALAARIGVELPISAMVAALTEGEISVETALLRLLARPLKEE